MKRSGTTASPRRRLPKALTTSSPARPARQKLDADAGRVTLAIITGAHGVGGEVKLKLFTEDLSAWRTFNDGALTLTSHRRTMARFAEASDRTAAEALRGTALTIARADLPPLPDGEYYHADLIGLRVQTPDGTCIGRIIAVENFGAGDLIEVERPDGKLFMAPFTPEAVPAWDAERLILDPIFAG
ncbi:ribosome maturation factor RimM [Sphingomonas sp.]|uniref:ribosome maturation factor RimM n=1 Tax=Sphingomonas sp. TaxID=28214 RepID=UPI003CC5C2F8